MKRLAGIAVGMAVMAAAVAASAQTIAVTGLTGQKLQLSAADVAALPHQPVALPLEGGKSIACQGAPLSAVLAKVGAPQGKALRGPELADVVIVGAADGYRVALALAETDPLMRPTPSVFLADRCNGAPMAAPDGPFRLIVLGEGRPARSARQVSSIGVVRP